MTYIPPETPLGLTFEEKIANLHQRILLFRAEIEKHYPNPRYDLQKALVGQDKAVIVLYVYQQYGDDQSRRYLRSTNQIWRTVRQLVLYAGEVEEGRDWLKALWAALPEEYILPNPQEQLLHGTTEV